MKMKMFYNNNKCKNYSNMNNNDNHQLQQQQQHNYYNHHNYCYYSYYNQHYSILIHLLLLKALLILTVTVQYTNASQALTFTIEPHDVRVPEGHSALLQCAGTTQFGKNQKASPQIRWRGPDGQDLGIVGDTFRNQLKNGSLYISSVEENRGLTGAYQCLLLVDGIGTIVSRPAIVSIARLPDLNQDFIETYLFPGQTAYFRCMTDDNDKQLSSDIKYTIQWYKDDLPLQLDKLRMVLLPNGALEIDEIIHSDRGVYQCNVTANGVSRLSSKSNLNIKKITSFDSSGTESAQMAPSFLIGPSPKIVKEGEIVTLHCVANGIPKPHIKWLRNGEELDLNDLDSRFSIIGTGSLQISSAEDIDSGNYQCRASNTVDSLDAQATLQVQVPPKFIQSPRDKSAYEKEELELECAIRGKPKPIIKWLKNGDAITPNDYMQLVGGHNLRILGLLPSDAGMFQCIGINPVGSVQAAARLRIAPPAKSYKMPKSRLLSSSNQQTMKSLLTEKEKREHNKLKLKQQEKQNQKQNQNQNHNQKQKQKQKQKRQRNKFNNNKHDDNKNKSNRQLFYKSDMLMKSGGSSSSSSSSSSSNNNKSKSSSGYPGESLEGTNHSLESTIRARIISKSALDSLLSHKIDTSNNRKFPKIIDRPLNDHHYDNTDLMDDDNIDNDEDDGNDDFDDNGDGNGDNNGDGDDDGEDEVDSDNDNDDDFHIQEELPSHIYDYQKYTSNDYKIGDDDDDDDDDDDNDQQDKFHDYIYRENVHQTTQLHSKHLNIGQDKSSSALPPASNASSILPQQQTSSYSSLDVDRHVNSGGRGGEREITAPATSPLESSLSNLSLINHLSGPPRDLLAQIVKPRFVTLSWSEPLRNPTEVISYTVYYKMNNSEREQKIVTKSSDELEVSIQSLIPGRTYHFWVVGNTNFGPGESSDILSVATQPEENISGPPRNVEGYARSHKEIFVKWEEPHITNGEILKYRVYYAEGDNGAESYHDTTALNVLLTELRPYTDYTITVVPFNKNGMGDPSNEIKIKTYSSTPSEPPNNVTLEVTSSTSITVHWEPPMKEDRNGQITGYKIRYRKLKDAPQVESTPANIRYYELNGLDRNSEYQVKIAAMTVNGSGPSTEWYRVMTLENDLDETQVPGKPMWMDRHPGADTIALHWAPPQEHEIKIRSYVLGWGRGIPDENTVELKESERYYILKDLEPNTEYVVSLRARNKNGDGPPVYDNIKTRDEDPIDIPTPLEVPVGLRAITMSSSSIVVYWIDTALNKNQQVTDNRHYIVRYGISNSSRYRYYNTSELNTMISDLRPNTQYEFAVKVVKGRRESAWSMAVLNTTYQNVPITPPRELTVQTHDENPQSVLLQWLPPKHTVLPIIGYNIYYTTDTNKRDRDWNIQTYTGEETSFILPQLKSHTTYYFKVQARTNKMIGGSSSSNSAMNSGAPFSALVAHTTGGVVSKVPPSQPTTKGINNEIILYTIIFGFTFVLLIVITVVIIMCRRKPQQSPENVKKSIPSSNSYQKNSMGVPKPPDLWIHHDQMELKNIDKNIHGSTPGCSDAASSSGALTLPRSVGHDYDVDTPVPNHITNSLDKRSYVPGYMTTSMNSTIERPQYPRTQYNISANRPHMNVDTGLSQQSLTQTQNNSLAQTPEHPHAGYDSNFCQSGYTNNSSGPASVGGSVPTSNGGISTIENSKRSHPLKSFSVPGPPPASGAGATPINKLTPAVTIRPQNQSPYKKPSFSAVTPNRLQGCPSVAHSNDEIQRLAPSTSTEELNQEMANLEGLMKDLSAITANEFEC